MKKLEEILLGGMFRPTEQNCPTREGELIGSLDKIHDIPNPRVGMRVYVENTGKEYIIKSLKDKTIGGVNVPNAAVDRFEEAVDLEVVQKEIAPLIDDIATEKSNRQNADNYIKASALRLEQSVNTTTDKVTIKGYSVDAKKEYSLNIPSATKEKAGVMSAEDKINLDTTVSRLGFYDETITLTSADLLPQVWNGTSVVSSTTYNTWVVPLVAGRKYALHSASYFLSRKVCSEFPSVGKTMNMSNVSLSNDILTATADTKYLVLHVKMEAYDNSDYVIDAEIFGVYKELKNTDNRVGLVTDNLNRVASIVGSGNYIREYTPLDFCNLIYNTSTFVVQEGGTYNGILLPISDGQTVRYIEMTGLSAKWGFKTMPYVGTTETPTRISGNTHTNGDGQFKYILIVVDTRTFTNAIVEFSSAGLCKDVEELSKSVVGSKPLVNKTIVCFGDSITEYNDSNDKGYGDYLAEMTGANVVRAGIGGTQLRTRKEPVEVIPDNEDDYKHAYGAVDISNLAKAWANNDWDIVDNAVAWLATNKNDNNSAVIDRLKNCPIESTDIVIVFGGTNDLDNSTFGDVSDTSATTTSGGINQIISSILAVKPDMPIYFFTPIPRMCPGGIWCDEYRASEGYDSYSFPNLVKKIEECVAYNHFPCCNWYNNIGINRQNIYTFANDGVHVTKAFKRLADRMYGFIMANRNWK